MINVEYVIFCVIIGLITYLKKALDLFGSLFMIILGLIIYLTAGFNWLILILIFLILGVLSTKYKHQYKKEIGVYEGTRTTKNVLSNGLVPCAMAVLGSHVGFIGSIATAAADTLASEIGVVETPRLITNFKKVPPGTDGGVSLLGTAAAILGAGIIGFFGYILGIYPQPLVSIKIAVIAGTFGCFVDSILGALFESRGYLTKEHVNLLATLTGAFLGIVIV